LSSTAALPFPLPGLRIYDTAASEPARSAALAALASASDDALVERVSRGDRDAFALLYRRYERPVFAVLLRLGGQRALAEEWLQEAFTRVWLAASSHDASRGAVRSWIFAIALNTARSELARRRGRTIVTVAGLALGVALVIVIASLTRGLREAQETALDPLASIGTL